MMKYFNANKVNFIIMSVFFLVIGIFVIAAAERYYAYKETLQNLRFQKTQLLALQQDLDMTTNSIEQIKKEQERFKEILFEERDVPAFLDGISGSAQKSLVYIMEMKTQQFNQVPVPKSISDSNMRPGQASQGAQNQAGYNSRDEQAKLSDMLTLASMPIHFKIHGTFNAIVNFLGSIENYRQLLTVSNVEISTDQNYPQLICEFTMDIYSLKKFRDI